MIFFFTFVSPLGFIFFFWLGLLHCLDLEIYGESQGFRPKSQNIKIISGQFNMILQQILKYFHFHKMWSFDEFSSGVYQTWMSRKLRKCRKAIEEVTTHNWTKIFWIVMQTEVNRCVTETNAWLNFEKKCMESEEGNNIEKECKCKHWAKMFLNRHAYWNGIINS